MKIKGMIAFLFLVTAGLAHAGTGFLKGEESSGFNKTCYYEGVSGAFTKTVRATQLCPQSADDGRGATRTSQESRTSGNSNGATSTGTRGQLTGERTSGLNKICYYSSIRGEFTKTIRATQICSLSATQ
jgi:hypothetical protein